MSASTLADAAVRMGTTLRNAAIVARSRLTEWDPGGRPDDAIVVAGSGRSGTTWLGEVIGRATHSRIVFEPFLVSDDPQRRLVCAGRGPASVAWNYSLYLPPDASHPGTQQVAAILGGRPRTAWTAAKASPGRYRQRVIKAIRANLLLGHLARQWPGVSVVLVVRNPLDVIESQLAKRAVGWQFGWDDAWIASQPLLAHRLRHVTDVWQRVSSLPELLACRWAIENYLALRDTAGLPNVRVVAYEQLTRGDGGWGIVAEHLRDRRWSAVAWRGAVARPGSSGATRGGVRRLSAPDVRRICEVLRAFGFDDRGAM